MNEATFQVTPVAHVRSELKDPASAPNQGDEGAPEAIVGFTAAVAPALAGLAPGDEIMLLSWLDEADREVLRVHPRGDTSRPQQGVFSTRSPHRPNPIGLHRVRILAIDGLEVRVSDLEAIDGTPILDVKPVLSGDRGAR
jgi:tRNA-Thr(GGU) m(6)t(6)A37 methyltransferase TsaA